MNRTMGKSAGVRILVALDDSPRSAAALAAAASLAAEFDAELAGLFIEDLNLQHLAGLPFAREFSLLSGVGRPFSRGDVEQTWRQEADTLQRQLAAEAERLSLRWSFRVARGRVAAEVHTQAQAFDLVVLGKRTGIDIVSVARTAVTSVAAYPRAGPILVLFEDVSTSAQSLELGAALARRNAADLVLLISAGSEDAFRSACDQAQAALNTHAMSGRCSWLPAVEGAGLAAVVQRESAACLVLAKRDRFLKQAGFEQLLDQIECPTVLAR